MKKIIFGTLFLGLVGLGVVGCKKEDLSLSNQPVNNAFLSELSTSINTRADKVYEKKNSENPFDSFGNDFMSIVLNNVQEKDDKEFIINDFIPSIYSQMNAKGYSNMLINQKKYSDLMKINLESENGNFESNILVELWRTDEISATIKEGTLIIRDAISKSNNIEDISLIITVSENIILSSNTLTQHEKETFLKSLSINKAFIGNFIQNQEKAAGKPCVKFALGFFGTIAGGPVTAVIGFGTMLAEAGDCEKYLKGKGWL